jgi:hypothetical protein
MTPVPISLASAFYGLTYAKLLAKSGPDQLKIIELLRQQGYTLIPAGTKYTDLRSTDEVLGGGKAWHTIDSIGGVGKLNQQHDEVVKDAYLIRRPIPGTATTTDDDEHTRLMRFFFGCKPSDPNKLPPAPRVFGRSWDDYDDW